MVNCDLTWENNLQTVHIIVLVDSEDDSQNRLTDSPFDMMREKTIWLNICFAIQMKSPFVSSRFYRYFEVNR